MNEIISNDRNEIFFDKYYSESNDINKIEMCLNRIIEDMSNKSMSAMVGAGFSINANKEYPNWAKLLVDAYKELYPKNPSKRKNETTKDYDLRIMEIIKEKGETRIAQEYEDFKGKRESLDIYIEKQFDKIDFENCDLELHKKLLSLNWCDIITTNWDTLLEEANNKSDYNYNIVKSAKELKQDNKKRIIKINGSLRSKQEKKQNEYNFDNCPDYLYVITDKDFQNYSIQHDGFSNLMKVKFLENTFCLFGFSGNDPNFKFWVKELKRTMTKGGNTEQPNPIFLISVANDPLTEDIKQFYANNYIVYLNLQETINIVKNKCCHNIAYKGSTPNTSDTDNCINNLSVFFDYIDQECKKNDSITNDFDKDNYDLLRKISVSEELTSNSKNAYCDLSTLFDFSNLHFSTNLAIKAQTIKKNTEVWNAEDFEYVSFCCLNNFYSLTNLYNEDVIEKLIEKFQNDIIPQKKATFFAELILKYYRETEQIKIFNDFFEKYKNNEEIKNYIYYEKALLLRDSFSKKELDKLLEEWKPESDENVDNLSLLRKISLKLAFNNTRLLKKEKIQELFEKINTNSNNQYIEYFIYFIKRDYLESLGDDVTNEIKDKINRLEERCKIPKEYLKKIYGNNKKASLRANSDTRYVYGSIKLMSNHSDNEDMINISRILNFFEYTGVSVFGTVLVSEMQGYIPKISENEYLLKKLLLMSIPLFGYTVDETELRSIAPRCLRFVNKETISKLYNSILQSLKHTIRTKENATILVYLITEFLKRVDDKGKNKFVQVFIQYIKNNEIQFVTKVSFGRVWGWEIPFIAFLDVINDSNDFIYVLKWVMSKYIEDIQRKNLEREGFSEYFVYYQLMINNEKFDKEKQVFFSSDESKELISKDLDNNKQLTLYACKYITEQVKEKIQTYLDENYSIQVNPYFITVFPSEQIKNKCIKVLEDLNVMGFDSRNQSILGIVKALLQSNLLNNEDIVSIAKICKDKYEILQNNNFRYGEDLKFNYLKEFKHVLFELKDKDEFKNISELQSAIALYKEVVLQQENVLSLNSLADENLLNLKSSFITSLSEFSYEHTEKENLYLFNLVLSKLLVQDSSDFEGILYWFIGVYKKGYGDKMFENEQTKQILLLILIKFKQNIAFCYDDLFIKDQMKELASTMKEKGYSSDVIDHWINDRGVAGGPRTVGSAKDRSEGACD